MINLILTPPEAETLAEILEEWIDGNDEATIADVLEDDAESIEIVRSQRDHASAVLARLIVSPGHE